MRIIKSMLRLFRKSREVEHQPMPPPHEVSISEFDSTWNQLSCELAGPHLNPALKVDEKKVEELRRKLKDLRARRE